MENTEAKNAIKKKNWFLAFFNDKSKTNLKWWNRNYFYAGTILIVVVNILIFAFVKKSPWDIVGYKENEVDWSGVFYFKTTLSTFLSSFFHSNWQHVLLNMLCFFVAGIYLERKMGTFGLLGFVLFASYVFSIAISANRLGVYHVGYSGVNYFIYSTIILDYIFSFQKHRRNKTNIILGAIVVALIYLAMCFNGGTSKISFSAEPYDLMHNMGHYTSFVAGIFVGLFTEAIKFSTRTIALKQNETKKESVNGIVIIETRKERKKKEKTLKEEAKDEVEVKEEAVEDKKDKKAKVEKKKSLKAEKKVKEEKVVENEESIVKDVTAIKVEEEQKQVVTLDKKLTALPEDMKNVPARKAYRKKKKVVSKTPPLVIKPVVSKQSKVAKKSDKK